MTETITRPSADVAIRVLRDRLTVVAGAIEQLPDGPARESLICARAHYLDAIEQISRDGDVRGFADAVHAALHVAIAVRVGCCVTSLGDVLSALGG